VLFLIRLLDPPLPPISLAIDSGSSKYARQIEEAEGEGGSGEERACRSLRQGNPEGTNVRARKELPEVQLLGSAYTFLQLRLKYGPVQGWDVCIELKTADIACLEGNVCP